MRLITQVTSLDTSSVLLKRFPRSGFFNFGNKSKAGGLMSGLYGGWRSICHQYFSKIPYTAPEAWGRALIYDRWSLREIWLQSVSSSISRLRFAEHGPRSLPIRTVFFTEVWLTTVAKFRMIASSYWPCKRIVQNFWNDQRRRKTVKKKISVFFWIHRHFGHFFLYILQFNILRYGDTSCPLWRMKLLYMNFRDAFPTSLQTPTVLFIKIQSAKIKIALYCDSHNKHYLNNSCSFHGATAPSGRG